MSDTVYLISSFGFKHGLPENADFVFDVRCLSNPYWVDEMRDMCGLDQQVDEYVFADDQSGALLDDVARILLRYAALSGCSGKRVYIGCTGGQHRSVAFAERLNNRLLNEGVACSVSHREYERFKK